MTNREENRITPTETKIQPLRQIDIEGEDVVVYHYSNTIAFRYDSVRLHEPSVLDHAASVFFHSTCSCENDIERPLSYYERCIFNGKTYGSIVKAKAISLTVFTFHITIDDQYRLNQTFEINQC